VPALLAELRNAGAAFIDGDRDGAGERLTTSEASLARFEAAVRKVVA
jgi:hypothetical protein